ncbi:MULTISPECIES: hypothetical protein [unclassified Providencia]|uniref:hypothetical protein n=1 Tax=unclassified Providencia TaxID=2633465 RepID=UPI003FA6D421
MLDILKAATLLTSISMMVKVVVMNHAAQLKYRYDILGRRTEKRLWKASAIANTITYPTREPDEVQTFGWVGMVLTHEHSSTKPLTNGDGHLVWQGQ